MTSILYLKCTAEAQKAIGLRKENLSEAQAGPAPLGNWLVHRFTVGRTCFFLFMSEVSLLSFVLYQGKKHVDERTLPTMFMAGLAHLLAMQELSIDLITQAVEQCGTGRYAKTDSRKTLGCMNDLVRCYSTMVEVQGGLATCDLTAIIRKINQMPQRTLNWGTAWEVTEALLVGSGSGRQ